MTISMFLTNAKQLNKLHVLAIVSSYLGQDKRRTLFNPYFVSISLLALIWLNHNKSMHDRINQQLKRSLRLINIF